MYINVDFKEVTRDEIAAFIYSKLPSPDTQDGRGDYEFNEYGDINTPYAYSIADALLDKFAIGEIMDDPFD